MSQKCNNWNRRDFIKGIGSAAIAIMLPQSPMDKQKSGIHTSLLYDDVYLKHETGEFAFENPQRLKAILAELEASHLLPSLRLIKPQKGGLEWVEAVHQKSYIETVRRDVLSGARELSTGHTLIDKDSFDVALWAVGGVLTACDAVVEGRARNAFCAIRPPGHHATPDKGMGFCIFNNAAVAARYVQKKHKLGKVLIIDWDVHHGNGTQEIFYKDGSVFYFSTHQWPWYPGTGRADETGEAEGKGTTLNVPLPAGSGDRELISAFENKLRPQIDNFKPDFIIISAGFDSRTGDLLGRFRVTDAGFQRLTRIVMQMADDHANGRLVSILEGGYSLKGLAQAASTHLRTLLVS